MGDLLIMNGKERNRKALLSHVTEGYLSLREAAPKLGVCYRQAKRLLRGYKERGDASLIHGLRGKRSPRAYPESFKSRVLKAYVSHYKGYGPTLAAEKLASREGLKLSAETLRQWLMKAGLWHKHRKRQSYRSYRERRACFGELVQIDGSIHEWFSGSGKHQCLLNMVDDATGNCYAQLAAGETTAILLTCLYQWIKRYGIPKAVYVDLKSVYISPIATGDDEGSVFQQVCRRLNIEIIKAYSPQAKGRVERKHAVFQDRLVKELKLHKITTIEAANAYLTKQFLSDINARYAKKAKRSENAHRPASGYGMAKDKIYWRYERQVQNDWRIVLNNQYYQLEKGRPLKVRAKQKVEVRRYLDGSIRVWRGEMEIKNHPIKKPEAIKTTRTPKRGVSSTQRSTQAKKNKSRTPWNQFNPKWLNNNNKKKESTN